VQVYVLTASNPDVKKETLRSAKLLEYFEDILSSTMPKKYPSKGDYIAHCVETKGWVPSEQLLADDSIEAIASTCGWTFSSGDEARKDAPPLAHTLRLPQHSKVGLTEEDLAFIDGLISSPPSGPKHYFTSVHEGTRFVDESDADLKCMEYMLNAETFQGVLAANPDALSEGRPDFKALLKSLPAPSAPKMPLATAAPSSSPKPAPAPAFAAALATDGSATGGKGRGKKGPPIPKGGMPPPSKEKAPAGPGEGDTIEVIDGANVGCRGTVLKVAGEGTEMRFRVLLHGAGTWTWVDRVKAVESEEGSPALVSAPARAPGKAAGKGPAPPPRGAAFSPPARSSCSVSQIKSADGVLSTDASGTGVVLGPPPPLPKPFMYLNDDSDSEATDSEMPELRPL